MLAVPDAVRNKAHAAGADAWLEHLPGLVTEIEELWSVSVERVYNDATEAFVAAVTTSTGKPAVLKVHIDREGDQAEREIDVLLVAAGNGCARLLRHDLARKALLLEQLGRSLFELGWPMSKRHAVLSDTVAQVWRHRPPAGLPSGAEKGRWLVDFIQHEWYALDRPCSEAAVDYALACADRRIEAHDDERAVLVHGDVHQWNALEAEGGFKLIDPDGLRAEPEYDLGIIMREDPLPLLTGDPTERASWLAARTSLDAGAVWEWGCVERVSTGLLGTRIGLQPVAREMLAAADRIGAMRPQL